MCYDLPLKSSYRVTHQVGPNLPLTPKQKLRFIIKGLYWYATLVLMSTGGWELPEWSPCTNSTLFLFAIHIHGENLSTNFSCDITYHESIFKIFIRDGILLQKYHEYEYMAIMTSSGGSHKWPNEMIGEVTNDSEIATQVNDVDESIWPLPKPSPSLLL